MCLGCCFVWPFRNDDDAVLRQANYGLEHAKERAAFARDGTRAFRDDVPRSGVRQPGAKAQNALVVYRHARYVLLL